jgi:predicted NBD/HSP70 family sugar kinase
MGVELLRRRVPTPQGDYAATLQSIAGLVHTAEAELGERGTVGIGTPRRRGQRQSQQRTDLAIAPAESV